MTAVRSAMSFDDAVGGRAKAPIVVPMSKSCAVERSSGPLTISTCKPRSRRKRLSSSAASTRAPTCEDGSGNGGQGKGECEGKCEGEDEVEGEGEVEGEISIRYGLLSPIRTHAR